MYLDRLVAFPTFSDRTTTIRFVTVVYSFKAYCVYLFIPLLKACLCLLILDCSFERMINKVLN